jgi:hypothetical protein
MSKRVSLSVMLLAASALGACVTPVPAHLALNAAEQNAITTTEIVAPIHQSEVYIYVPPSQMAASGQGGLLGVLVLSAIDAGVNNTRTSNAEKAIKPVRDAVVDFDFDSMIRDDLRASVSKVAWMHIDAARVVKDLNDTSLDEDITNSKDGAVLLTMADYHFSNDGRQLFVILNANLYANSPALNAMKPKDGKPEVVSAAVNALYRNLLMFTVDMPAASSDRPVNMNAWAANHGAALRSALTLASAKLSGLLADDIQRIEDPKTPPVKRTADEPVSNDANGAAVRHVDGTLAYTAKPAVL